MQQSNTKKHIYTGLLVQRSMCGCRQKDTLTYAFRQLDQNKDGCICADDLTSFLTLKGIQADMIYILNTMQQLNCRSGGRLDLAKVRIRVLQDCIAGKRNVMQSLNAEGGRRPDLMKVTSCPA